MVFSKSQTKEEERENKLPDSGETVIVADQYISAHAPPGYDTGTEDDHLNYERGDALPASTAADCAAAFPDRVIVLDADGGVVQAPDDHTDDRIARTLQMWEDGGFDPAEYRD